MSSDSTALGGPQWLADFDRYAAERLAERDALSAVAAGLPVSKEDGE